VFVDAEITVSRLRILEAADRLSRDQIRHLINTHWHFDHADGNAWLNAEGAAIIAHVSNGTTCQTVTRLTFRVRAVF
jgi:glyoxylase-like metal-dependent hydrolase (beta-lactamase superfamily II)